ncbi:MAG TPA: ATP synthase F1 subunit gamma [Patescibacteria group bacterium]|jgi:F-type H+-transporting ATPase subunit gamma|nr:ATP synthase F1 subunit gamma [Patescibacteria group bacterium]
MANVRDIRRRIRSVKSTQQVTKAMKMVAAAKLRRAQERIVATRPYANQMLAVLNSLATRANPDTHPLLAVRGSERIELLIITADKGLCGGFNTNIIKHATAFIEQNKDRVLSTHLVGRKGRDYFKKRGYTVTGDYVDLFRGLKYEDAAGIARSIMTRYIERDLDAVYLVYNEFKSVIQQKVVVERLLPIQRLELPPEANVQDYIYEPSAQALFDSLLPRHVEFQVLRALYESAAAEFGARMSAMGAATRNADEMINTLTLYMNRVRQASITKEIIEVVSGAEAT